jgi:spore coat polysaccharide biosynthesis protein SpsF
MRIGAIVLGRLGSRRLPGKVLIEVEGKPILGYVLDRLERVPELDEIVVATSERREDDRIADYCAARETLVHRGATEDVLGRVIAAAGEQDLDAVARVNADSPWLDPVLLGDGVRRMREGRYDLITNLTDRMWPYGVAVEVARTESLAHIYAESSDPDRLEHVTRGFYEDPERFSILSMRLEGVGYPGLRLTIDTEEDLVRFRRLVRDLAPDVAGRGIDEVVAAARRAGLPDSDPIR